MNISDRLKDGIVLLGCGKMGSAMLGGWLDQGIDPKNIWIIEPNPSEWLKSLDIQLNATLPERAALALIAVKPQMMHQALPRLASYASGATIFLSVAAGISIDVYESILGKDVTVVRAMPNTPAAIGQGITALIGNHATGADALQICQELLGAVGQTIRLETEAQMDAVTGVSGSGPAYVFFMIDALAAAGQAQGLPMDLAMQLAKATVSGAGALAAQSHETPEQLRINVTSPNGTTQAGLKVLMHPQDGLRPLITETVAKAAGRSRELSDG
jgi:pyrroline-5-carboxylate reductase